MTLFVQILKKRFLLTFTAVCASILLVAITLWWNIQLSDIINTISEGNTVSTNTIILAVIIIFVMCVFNYIKTYISSFACETLAHDLRTGYARYISLLPISEMEHLNAGEQVSKLQNEIDDVSRYLSDNLFQLVHDSISFISTFGWLLILNTKLTVVVNLPVFIIMVYVFYSSKIISSVTKHSQQAKGRINKYADTLLTLFPIIWLYDATCMIVRNYNKEVGEWEYQTVRAERIQARLMSLSGLLSNIPLMLLFLVGGGMVIKGTLTVGTLYVFLNLSKNVSGVMMNMPKFIAAFRKFSVNMNRLSEKIILDGRRQPI